MFGLKKILILPLILFGFLFAQDNIQQYYGPNKDLKKKINIAYYQGGDYFNYPILFKQVIKNLSEQGSMP